MAGFTCGVCGQIHPGLPMDLAYQRPADYFKVPADERARRVKLNSDLCVIDDQEFYVRGVLALPVQDSTDEFRWGIWARVEADDFARYVELYDIEVVDGEPPFRGRLAGGIKSYPGSDMLEVTVQLQSGGQRPLFVVADREHPLGRDQAEGISMERVHGFIEDAMPGYFDQSPQAR